MSSLFLLFLPLGDEQLQEESINALVTKKVSNVSGAAIRIGNAKIIFKHEMQYEALKIIIQSNRVAGGVIQKAKELLD